MKIIASRPPNFDLIVKAFPLAINSTIIFSYGDTIYNPSGQEIPFEIIAHEEVHGERQLKIGVDAWWDEYIKSEVFRYNEELLAHRAEYKAAAENGSRQVRRGALKQIAKRLAHPLYGSMVTHQQAMDDLKGEEK